MNPKVLLFEDDLALREMLQEALHDDGYTVTVCESLAEIAASAEEDSSTVALVDGWGESYRDLQSGEADEIHHFAARIPTVMLTGRDWARTVSADDLGLVALLKKPIELDELSSALKRLVARLTDRSSAAQERSRHLSEQTDAARGRLTQALQKLDGSRGLHPPDLSEQPGA